jgi:purine catabolism regulator
VDLTVRDMLDLEALKSLRVIAGCKGLNNKVQNITFLDAPDAIMWIRGNEFIITTLYLFRTTDEQLELIERLASQRVSALGIKQDRFIHGLSPEVLELANKRSLPLLSIPYEKAWVDLINPVMAELLNRQLVILEKSNAIRRLFTRLVLEGGTLQSIAKLLSALTGNPITIMELTNKKVVTWPNYFEYRLDPEILPGFKKGEERGLKKVSNGISDTEGVVFPVEVAKHIEGFVIVWEVKELSCLDYEAIEQANTVVALYIQRLKAVNEVNQRFKDDFIDRLLHKEFSAAYMKGKAKEMGWVLADSNRVVVAKADGVDWGKSYDIFKYFTGVLKGKFNILVGMDGDQTIIFVVPVQKDETGKNEIIELISSARERLIAEDPRLRIGMGIGRVCNNIENISKSFKEAKTACRVSIALNRICDYEGLGSYSLLVELLEFEETKVFLEQLIYPLVNYDKDNNASLLETLGFFINTNCSYRETARRMHVHHNTVRYRLGVIEDILKIDLKKPETVLNLMLAIKLHNLKNIGTTPIML